MLEITPSTPAHVRLISVKLRAGDKDEVEAAGLRPGQAVWRSWRGSLFSKVALVDGELAAIWGMGGSPFGKVGEPWLLTTPAVERVKLAFVKTARREVADMLLLCPALQGYVDASYTKAVRLLEMVGFKVENPLPFGRYGAPFRRYRMERPR